MLKQEGLFRNNLKTRPLAERIRPKTLNEVVLPPGVDEHLIASWKRRTDRPPSLILWGPPGSGKTTLARALGKSFHASFYELSAVQVGVKEIKEITAKAMADTAPSILFLDEVHRFNKAQQDILLPSIENGTISFIGATTENPSFALNSALISRCQVLHLMGFHEALLEKILERALETLEMELPDEDKKLLIHAAQGDARFLVRTLEDYVEAASTARASGDQISVRDYLQNSPHIHYSRQGDEHFDSISAFIKSMRRGDTDGALYFAFRMIAAGEDPRYLLRRMVIFASEDIGNAEPNALTIANQAAEAYERLGLPEGKIPISQAICYLSKAPKSRACYNALQAVDQFIERHPNIPIPLHLRNRAPLGLRGEEEKALTATSILADAQFYREE